LFAHARWLSPGTPVSSTTKTGRHHIAEILLKVALKHQKSKSNLAAREPIGSNWLFKVQLCIHKSKMKVNGNVS
jgi:hypothetical protein